MTVPTSYRVLGVRDDLFVQGHGNTRVLRLLHVCLVILGYTVHDVVSVFVKRNGLRSPFLYFFTVFYPEYSSQIDLPYRPLTNFLFT